MQVERPEQIAYIVADLEAAIAHHAKRFGSGPFFVRRIDGGDCTYRGAPGRLNVKFALGQWGDVQLELIQNLDAGPSVFHELDVVGSSQPRFHHVCLLPESQEKAIADFAADGMPVVHEFTTPVGTRIVLIDALEQHGHFVELHERASDIERVYANIREAAANFDGERLVRPFEEALQPPA
jgi:hypothetical protein